MDSQSHPAMLEVRTVSASSLKSEHVPSQFGTRFASGSEQDWILRVAVVERYPWHGSFSQPFPAAASPDS